MCVCVRVCVYVRATPQVINSIWLTNTLAWIQTHTHTHTQWEREAARDVSTVCYKNQLQPCAELFGRAIFHASWMLFSFSTFFTKCAGFLSCLFNFFYWLCFYVLVLIKCKHKRKLIKMIKIYCCFPRRLKGPRKCDLKLNLFICRSKWNQWKSITTSWAK